jgi:hypothetical protein
LTNDEAQQTFGIDLASNWIQAIWVEVENKDVRPFWLFLPALDPEYYAPDEVAFAFHGSMS